MAKTSKIISGGVAAAAYQRKQLAAKRSVAAKKS
jgi:hypothetical protein